MIVLSIFSIVLLISGSEYVFRVSLSDDRILSAFLPRHPQARQCPRPSLPRRGKAAFSAGRSERRPSRSFATASRGRNAATSPSMQKYAPANRSDTGQRIADRNQRMHRTDENAEFMQMGNYIRGKQTPCVKHHGTRFEETRDGSGGRHNFGVGCGNKNNVGGQGRGIVTVAIFAVPSMSAATWTQIARPDE